MSIESVMLSNHLILPSVFPRIKVFSNESGLHIRGPKHWSFSFSNSPSNEYSGLISFRTDWLDLLDVQGTLKSLLQDSKDIGQNLLDDIWGLDQFWKNYIRWLWYQERRRQGRRTTGMSLQRRESKGPAYNRVLFLVSWEMRCSSTHIKRSWVHRRDFQQKLCHKGDILQGNRSVWGITEISAYMHACLIPQSCLTLLWSHTVACQAPLSMGFPRQEYWSELPFPSLEDLPNPGIETVSPCLLHWQVDSLLAEPYQENHYRRERTLTFFFASHNSERYIYPNVNCSTSYNSQDKEATWMSINRRMDREDVARIYGGILLGHKKEQNYVICRDVDRLRVCHTEWSMSEGEKQTLYINEYMWNLEKWYWWTYLQGRNRDADREWTCEHSGGRGGWEELRD